jgi:hypothetical protein
MPRSNAGRSTTGGPKVSYYRGSDRIEAAKHLRLVMSRYLVDRANFSEVEEAMDILRNAAESELDAKICTTCKSARGARGAPWTCRHCGARACEHKCGNKDGAGMASCTSCLVRK